MLLFDNIDIIIEAVDDLKNNKKVVPVDLRISILKTTCTEYREV